MDSWCCYRDNNGEHPNNQDIAIWFYVLPSYKTVSFYSRVNKECRYVRTIWVAKALLPRSWCFFPNCLSLEHSVAECSVVPLCLASVKTLLSLFLPGRSGICCHQIRSSLRVKLIYKLFPYVEGSRYSVPTVNRIKHS